MKNKKEIPKGNNRIQNQMVILPKPTVLGKNHKFYSVI
jgi:hypothetical protein